MTRRPRCPGCNDRYVKFDDSGNAVLLVTGPIEFTGSGCSGRCMKCRRVVPLPIAFVAPASSPEDVRAAHDPQA